jgi:hypothetical protein
VVRQLHVPKAGELIHKEGILFDDSIEDILEDENQTQSGWLVGSTYSFDSHGGGHFLSILW